MKFSPFNLKERKVLNIPVPKKGINLTKSTLSLDDGEIGFSKNVLFENQSLKTRKGIVGSTDNIFYYPIADGADDFDEGIGKGFPICQSGRCMLRLIKNTK